MTLVQLSTACNHSLPSASFPPPTLSLLGHSLYSFPTFSACYPHPPPTYRLWQMIVSPPARLPVVTCTSCWAYWGNITSINFLSILLVEYADRFGDQFSTKELSAISLFFKQSENDRIVTTYWTWAHDSFRMIDKCHNLTLNCCWILGAEIVERSCSPPIGWEDPKLHLPQTLAVYLQIISSITRMPQHGDWKWLF